MLKKEYLEPAMEIVRINAEAQILSASVTDIIATGIDEDIDMDDEDKDSWNDGW